jgi:hypothetical protein
MPTYPLEEAADVNNRLLFSILLYSDSSQPMKTKITKFCLSLSFFLIPAITWAATAAGPFDYVPLEKIPGSDAATSSVTDFYTYLQAVYKFGIWAVGIAALLMITVGGYMYITSAGNNTSMEKAKGVITDAIVGLILALAAYLILYVINPDLTKIQKLPNSSAIGGTTAPAASPVAAPSGAKTCNDGKCSQIDSAISSNSAGVSPDILKSLMVGGEGCNNNHSSDGKSCGYGQIQYVYMKSVCGLSGTNEDLCARMKSDTTLDINCTAKFVQSQTMPCAKKVFGNTDISSLASCYNAGYTGKCGTNNYCQRVSSYYSTCSST